MFELVSVSKSYDAKPVLQDISFSTATGQTTAVIGPSGGGKSTLFGLMTGLLKPDSGEILFEGERVTPDRLALIRRRIGYVIQDGGLFPHLTGLANVALMARHLGWDKEKIRGRIEQLSALARLSPDLLSRYPAELSGGQRQRVSLMRALMLDADVLLFDEALAALDPMVRAELQDDLAEIFSRLKKTVVIVTHDMNEAAFFAHRIILIKGGRIIQEGTADDLFNRPAEPFVHDFVRAQQQRARGGISMSCFRVFLSVIGLIVSLSADFAHAADNPVRVGSKVFTESVILGELATQLGRNAGVNTVHRSQLGGTRVLWDALVGGQIDAYPEYTGTITQELLPGTLLDQSALTTGLARHGIGITRSLGFNDTYAIGMLESTAARYNIKTIGDLRNQPQLRLGFSNEFLERKDGWPAARATYNLPQKNVTGLDHDLAYRALASGDIDVTDLYSTEPEIAFLHLRVLEDDQHLFPEYKGVYLYRLDLNQRAPAFIKAISMLQGQIDAARMIAMNGEAKLNKIPESRVASEFLHIQLHIDTHSDEQSMTDILLLRTREHLLLVGISLAASILISIPMGVLAFTRPRLGQLILAVLAVIYTIPSLALLVFMIPLLGIGTLPAVCALFLYGLLPIVRNTYTGLTGISPGLRESAIVLGLSPIARLLQIELPIAAPSILAGIKTAAVINVGTATLGALIGAGGYGQPILTGIRLADTRMILLGAIPAAILALLVQGGFSLLERLLLPRGLRLTIRS